MKKFTSLSKVKKMKNDAMQQVKGGKEDQAIGIGISEPPVACLYQAPPAILYICPPPVCLYKAPTDPIKQDIISSGSSEK